MDAHGIRAPLNQKRGKSASGIRTRSADPPPNCRCAHRTRPRISQFAGRRCSSSMSSDAIPIPNCSKRRLRKPLCVTTAMQDSGRLASHERNLMPRCLHCSSFSLSVCQDTSCSSVTWLKSTSGNSLLQTLRGRRLSAGQHVMRSRHISVARNFIGAPSCLTAPTVSLAVCRVLWRGDTTHSSQSK